MSEKNVCQMSEINICEMFEKELLECTDMDLDFNEKKYSLHLDVFLMVDSKLINLATGLGMYILLI